MTSAPSIVNVIVAADYGERLRDLPGEEGFFIAASCADITEPSAVAPGQFPETNAGMRLTRRYRARFC